LTTNHADEVAGQQQQRNERIHYFNLDLQRCAGIERRYGLKQMEQCQKRKGQEQEIGPAKKISPQDVTNQKQNIQRPTSNYFLRRLHCEEGGRNNPHGLVQSAPT
jgi:hypothetical protein